MASAWSMQFPQFYHTLFPTPTPTPTPLPLRPLFQDPLLQPRYYVHAPIQFRQPLQLYQPPPAARLPTVPSTNVLTSSPPVTDVHHHHHVFHYYYNIPTGGGTQRTGRNGDRRGHVVRQLCDDHPATVDGYPSPVYIPVPSPSPPPPTPTTTPPSPLAPPLCDHDNDENSDDDDDTVVVDNVDYFPFDRRLKAAATVTGDRSEKANHRSNSSRQNTQKSQGQKNKSNFILANYLLPPDK